MLRRTARVVSSVAASMLLLLLGSLRNSYGAEVMTGPQAAPQIVVESPVLPATEVPPASILNVSLRFRATEPVGDSYSLHLWVAAEDGTVVAEKKDDLNNSLLILPTNNWRGPIAFAEPLAIPSVPDGVYEILLTLEDARGAVKLTAGPDVTEDSLQRLHLGKIHVRSGAPTPAMLGPRSLDLTGYKMTFDEEFKTLSISDAAKFDGSRWYSQNERCCMITTDGRRTEMASRNGSYDPFLLTPGGGLTIRLTRAGDLWSSGVLTSVDSNGQGFSQQYGYFEMSAQFPSGLNTWPAFWLLNTASKSSGAPAGEIDITEYISNPRFPQYMATTLHDWSNKSTPAMSHTMIPLPTDGFHTYGMLWTAETMTFYVDGSITFQVPTPAIMHQPYYLLVDLGLGGGWPTQETPVSNDMQVRWIRAYSRVSTPSAR